VSSQSELQHSSIRASYEQLGRLENRRLEKKGSRKSETEMIQEGVSHFRNRVDRFLKHPWSSPFGVRRVAGGRRQRLDQTVHLQVARLRVPRGSRGEEGEDAGQVRRQEVSPGGEAFRLG
jgi:hypothetical protein